MSQIPIMKLTSEDLETLRATAHNTPEMWLNPRTDFGRFLKSVGISRYAEATGLYAQGEIRMPPVEGNERNRRHRADHHALQFHRNIPRISPTHMAAPQILVWLSCFHLLEYGISRWPVQRGVKLSTHVNIHYLAQSGADVTDASVAGRTLWIAELAQRVAVNTKSFTPEEVLAHFASHPESYHRCTSYNIMKSPLITAEFMRTLMTTAQ